MSFGEPSVSCLQSPSPVSRPHAVSVYPVDVRSQRLELSVEAPEGGEEQNMDGPRQQALKFPSSDGFEIEVKLTCEWSIDEARAAEVFVRIGTNEGGGDPMDEVLHKILIPALRGNSRIEGSKYPAANYIAGESRTVFQQSIFDSLKAACADQGIIIRSVLVNDIVPPPAIATPIRDREVAKEELARNAVQLQQAKAEQSLARETELIGQQDVKVKSETEKSTRTIGAEGQQRIALIEQERALAVAKADLAAAELQAGAIIARGRADADVILAQNVAEAEALRASVSAFSTPGGFAAYTFATRIGPRISVVFADPDGAFGAPFRELLAPQGAGETRR
jgi:regulator of protease activity HflC (stomatin/prohibitin superfamily)